MLAVKFFSESLTIRGSISAKFGTALTYEEDQFNGLSNRESWRRIPRETYVSIRGSLEDVLQVIPQRTTIHALLPTSIDLPGRGLKILSDSKLWSCLHAHSGYSKRQL